MAILCVEFEKNDVFLSYLLLLSNGKRISSAILRLYF